ncbi:hypothetical protein Tco_0579373 [Tanacetum coccineum]
MNPTNNPGSSSQPPYNYYPNFQTPFVNPDELSLFNQWKMQQQMGFNQFSQQQQQQPNQSTASQPQSDHQSFNLIDETEDENEEELIPTPTSKKTSRGARLKAKAKKTKETESQVKIKKRARNVWTQDEELILAESFIQISKDPKVGCYQQKDTFWYKILDVYNTEAKRRGFIERTKNMLTGKRNRFRVTDDEPEHFGDDALPRPPGLQRIAKSQRSGSNLTASSGSNPMMYQEFMKEQYELDRKAKMQVIEQESEERRHLIHAQRIAEETRVLQIDTRGMDPADAVIINAQKARIRAAYQPPSN